MTLTERASYIKGLADGCNLDKNSECGKLVAALIDLTADMAAEIADLREYIEEIDEDLGAVEEIVYDDECDCDCDCDDDDCDCCCCDDDDCDCDCCCDCDCDCDDEFEYDEYVCPECKETISFSGEFDEEELVCPNCGAKLEEA